MLGYFLGTLESAEFSALRYSLVKVPRANELEQYAYPRFTVFH